MKKRLISKPEKTISWELRKACQYLKKGDHEEIAEKTGIGERYVYMIIGQSRYNKNVERELIIKVKKRLNEVNQETNKLSKFLSND